MLTLSPRLKKASDPEEFYMRTAQEKDSPSFGAGFGLLELNRRSQAHLSLGSQESQLMVPSQGAFEPAKRLIALPVPKVPPDNIICGLFMVSEIQTT